MAPKTLIQFLSQKEGEERSIYLVKTHSCFLIEYVLDATEKKKAMCESVSKCHIFGCLSKKWLMYHNFS